MSKMQLGSPLSTSVPILVRISGVEQENYDNYNGDHCGIVP